MPEQGNHACTRQSLLPLSLVCQYVECQLHAHIFWDHQLISAQNGHVLLWLCAWVDLLDDIDIHPDVLQACQSEVSAGASLAVEERICKDIVNDASEGEALVVHEAIIAECQKRRAPAAICLSNGPASEPLGSHAPYHVDGGRLLRRAFKMELGLMRRLDETMGE